MTKSKGVGKGGNPASHRNKPKLGNEPSDRLDARLLPHQKQTALELGNGNASDGVRKALNICSRDYSQLPTPGKVVAILLRAQVANEPTKSELIAEALEYLESWSVERSWEVVKAETVTVTKTKGGAYII